MFFIWLLFLTHWAEHSMRIFSLETNIISQIISPISFLKKFFRILILNVNPPRLSIIFFSFHPWQFVFPKKFSSNLTLLLTFIFHFWYFYFQWALVLWFPWHSVLVDTVSYFFEDVNHSFFFKSSFLMTLQVACFLWYFFQILPFL